MVAIFFAIIVIRDTKKALILNFAWAKPRSRPPHRWVVWTKLPWEDWTLILQYEKINRRKSLFKKNVYIFRDKLSRGRIFLTAEFSEHNYRESTSPLNCSSYCWVLRTQLPWMHFTAELFELRYRKKAKPLLCDTKKNIVENCYTIF
jgi:hypothetical protein